MNHFKGKQFEKDVIIFAIGYYFRYNLSYRDIKEILLERGVNVCHTTIHRWVKEYGKLIYKEWINSKHNKSSKWKIDETYIKVKGKWKYLYRAIDDNGMTLDFWLRSKRDRKSAYQFLKRLLTRFGEPDSIVTDKAPSTLSAIIQLKKSGYLSSTKNRATKYLNNLIEQDHRKIKKRSRWYKSFETASTTIQGMETIHAIFKEKRSNLNFDFSVVNEINKLLIG